MLFWVGGWLGGGWVVVGGMVVRGPCMCCNNMVSYRISNRRTERVIDSPRPAGEEGRGR